MPPKSSTIQKPQNETNAKRKASQPSSAPASKKPRFNTNIKDARTLLTQPASASFANGELDVDKFVRAREFEIHALEKGMQDAKKARHRRAFQEVPRELRRRTAAHDVKRVPRRLRDRARREMLEDNTPTVNKRSKPLTPRMRLRVERAKRLKGMNRNANRKRKEKRKTQDDVDITVVAENAESKKNGQACRKDGQIKSRKPRVKAAGVLKIPPVSTSKFRRRQIHKSWLPTHMFHTKRARMAAPSAPLWRFAIPLSPTQKSYRPTHRSSQTRGAVAWDTSYMSTIGLTGTEKSIQGLLMALGFGRVDKGCWEKKKSRIWRAGTRIWEGWLDEREAPHRPIAPVTIIWCADGNDKNSLDVITGRTIQTLNKAKLSRRQLIIRVHPSAFLQLWEEVVRAAKVQRPSVTVEDLRFEIGSIEIMGPNSTEALAGCLHPSDRVGTDPGSMSMGKVVRDLVSVSNLSSLPADILLSFTISDPRLHHPPAPVQVTSAESSKDIEQLQQQLLTLSSALEVLPQNPLIFDRSARLTASRLLPSQKAINRRKSSATPGHMPAPLPSDPDIPIVLFLCKQNCKAKWTLLAPWKTITPIWNHLMHQPLSVGGVPRFGGLDEIRQVAFEAGDPWFPGDFPGTKAGMQWEEEEAKRRLGEWERRPKSKRITWESLELASGRKGEVGKGWSCDWDYLLDSSDEKQKNSKTDDSGDSASTMDIDNAKGKAKPQPPPLRPQHISFPTIMHLLGPLRTSDSPSYTPHIITTVRLTLLARGTATPCARIYRLPSGPAFQSWLTQIPSSDKKPIKETKLFRRGSGKDTPASLAALLLSSQTKLSSAPHPDCPEERDLIGFVTTGAFNLSEGKATAIGCVAVKKVVEAISGSGGTGYGQHDGVIVPGFGFVRWRQVCIVRNAGEKVGRVAVWEVV